MFQKQKVQSPVRFLLWLTAIALMATTAILSSTLSPMASHAKQDVLGLTATSGNGFIHLEWTLSGNSDVTGYKLERKRTKGSHDWEQLVTFGANGGNRYLDAGVTNETYYRYRLSALPDSLNITSKTPRLRPRSSSSRYLPPPSDLMVESTVNKGRQIRVMVSWIRLKYVNLGYPNSFTVAEDSSEWPRLGGSHANGRTSVRGPFGTSGPSEGLSLSYKVKFYLGDYLSSYSAPVEITTPILTPQNLTAAGDDREVTLNWDSTTAPIGYMVQRRTAKPQTSDWQTIAENTRSSTPTYADTGLEYDTTYRYRVAAIRSEGTSRWSNTVSVETEALPLPPSPKYLTAASSVSRDGTYTVHLGWGEFWGTTDDTLVTGYRIARMDTSNSYAVIVENTGNKETDYSDFDVSAGNHYWYRVWALNADGVPSESYATHHSNMDWAQTVDLAVQNLAATVGADYSVKLTWDLPIDQDFADSFYIYRDGEKIAEYIWISGSITSHTDTTAERGATHSYQVKTETANQFREWSTTVEVTVP